MSYFVVSGGKKTKPNKANLKGKAQVIRQKMVKKSMFLTLLCSYALCSYVHLKKQSQFVPT